MAWMMSSAEAITPTRSCPRSMPTGGEQVQVGRAVDHPEVTILIEEQDRFATSQMLLIILVIAKARTLEDVPDGEKKPIKSE
jgi:hypothetical protein